MSDRIKEWDEYFGIHCHLPAAAIRDLFDEIERLRAAVLLNCEYPRDCIGPLVPWESATQSRCNSCERKREALQEGES